MQKSHLEYCCRWSPTLGALEDTHQKIWGTKEYDALTDMEKPTVFFGIYGLPDWYALWRHKGKRYILWAGSDITHFLKGYWLNPEGTMNLNPFQLAPWIDTYCESYVENEVEKAALASVGIRAKVVPSFLGDIHSFELNYKPATKPSLYTSVSGNEFRLYGWDKLPELAAVNPGIEFHCYGNTVEPFSEESTPELPRNIFLHGRVTKEKMNEEISKMQGALRLCAFDGFSEILAKSVLMGQWPVSFIEYPHILKLEEIGLLDGKTEPNQAGKEYYQKNINKFPWAL